MTFTTCFVCARCEHPICGPEDILVTSVTSGTTQNAFMYDLEDLLELETSVPCYTGDEVDEVSLAVSEKILAAPFPPAARLLALEAVVESQRFQRQQDVRDDRDSLRISERDDSLADASSSGSAAESAVGELPTQNSGEPVRTEYISSSGGAYRSAMRSLALFRRVKETRLDLVCVKEDVLMGGLACCTKDRSADIPPGPSSLASGITTAPRENTGVTSAVSGDSSEDTEAILPSVRHVHAIFEAAQRPPPRTRWLTHPGNFDVEEAFIHVRRRTKTARCPWFEAYDCRERLECPDCHLGLGYLFMKKGEGIGASEMASGVTGAPPCDAESEDVNPERAHEPHQKRGRREDQMRCDEEDQQEGQEGRNVNSAEQFPATFVGLELKKLRQREWGLRDFQKRYQQAKDLKTFRELFPEAEELETLYGRLTALRTQSELYNNLLRKHKEQNDVQSALLQSQKERINTYEEKLVTMQQIIEAQRTQLEMQGQQIKQQEQLVRNQKSQVVTQRHQIYVEQLLLSEQSRTIVTQREQLSLIQAHLRAQIIKERLEERCGQLTTLISQAEEQRQAQRSTPSSTNEWIQHPPRTPLPPLHLLGIVGHDTQDNEPAHPENSEEKDSVVQSHHSSQSTVVPPVHSSTVSDGNESRNGAERETHRWAMKTPSAVATGVRRENRLSSSSTTTSTKNNNGSGSSSSKDMKLSERTAGIMPRLAEERKQQSTYTGTLRSTTNNNSNNNTGTTTVSTNTASSTGSNSKNIAKAGDESQGTDGA